MNKTKIISGFCLVLILFFNLVLAGVPEKPAPVKGEKENNAASGFKPEEKSGGLIRPRRTATEKTSGINPDATKSEKGSVQEKNLTPANFKLITDVIDGFGGQKSNSGCDRYVFAGGQSSAIGPGTSTSFKLYAGFVHSTVVKCGDANADGSLTVADVVYLVNYLFKGGPVAKPYEAGEANCDGKVTVSDVVYLVNYLFKGGPVPIC
ncbi:MAG: hypothetical protein A2W07_04875 [candidate division Zixibacteria bacterium RBG_16_43_9]|nr:MAG: hypothetical protein A2W07_04875 [candidate division Zixibacteria bacterium RBG_16_43_9]